MHDFSFPSFLIFWTYFCLYDYNLGVAGCSLDVQNPAPLGVASLPAPWRPWVGLSPHPLGVHTYT